MNMLRTTIALIIVALLVTIARADGKETAHGLNERGVEAVNRGDFAEAIRLFGEARAYLPLDVTLRKNLAAAHARRGLKRAKDGKDAEATKDLKWAVHYDPDSATYRVNLALCLMAEKELVGARKQFETVLVKHPRNPDALEHYGRLLYGMNDLPGAVKAWKAVLAVSPERARVRTALAKAMREQKAEAGMRHDVSAHFAITFDGERNERVARLIGEALEDAYTTIGYELGHYPRERVQVILYTKEQFQTATEAKSWVGGLYDGKIRLPIRGRTGSEAELIRTIVHEYVHVIVRDLAPRCPIWLNEGMAQLLEGKTVSRSDRIAAAAQHAGRLLTLKDLTRPFATITDSKRAALAYAQAHSLASFLARTRGGRSFADFLQAMKAGKKAPAAFELAFSGSMETTYGNWLEELRQRSASSRRR
jgi:tetratricopeptide (TPR) repeat protein